MLACVVLGCNEVGRIASEEVICELIKSKCLPVLMYGLDMCVRLTQLIGNLHSLQ